MKTILLSNHYKDEPYEIITKALPPGFRLEMLDQVQQEELEKKAALADYILASGRLKINAAVLERARDLKMIQRTGVGLDSLDLQELSKRNIPVYVNQGVNAVSVAEHTVLFILACLRRLSLIHANTKKGIWNKQVQGVQTHTLEGRTIGIVGMGHIAQKTVEILQPFGAELLYYSPHRKEMLERKWNLRYVSQEELFKRSDVISLHCPLTEQTQGMISKDTIGLMKDGVILINTARGGLVCERDFVQAVQSGKISYAALDVYEEEPTHNTDLLQLENVITTPHIAGVTYDAFYQMMHDAMHNIDLFERGELEKIAVNRLQ